MKIRRVDFALLKPGRAQDHIALFHEVGAHLHRLGVGKVVLSRESVAGIGQPRVYAFVDWESPEAYGEFFDTALADSAFQSTWQKLFADDAPSTFLGTALLSELVTYGTEPANHPGTAAIVRRWKRAHGATEALLNLWEGVAPHVKEHGGYSGIWNLMVAGEATGDLVTGVAFPNMTELGKWLEFIATDDVALRLIAPFQSADPPAEHIEASIDIVMASSSP